MYIESIETKFDYKYQFLVDALNFMHKTIRKP